MKKHESLLWAFNYCFCLSLKTAPNYPPQMRKAPNWRRKTWNVSKEDQSDCIYTGFMLTFDCSKDSVCYNSPRNITVCESFICTKMARTQRYIKTIGGNMNNKCCSLHSSCHQQVAQLIMDALSPSEHGWTQERDWTQPLRLKGVILKTGATVQRRFTTPLTRTLTSETRKFSRQGCQIQTSAKGDNSV